MLTAVDFVGFDSAKSKGSVREDSVWFKPGKYELQVNRLKPSVRPNGAKQFIAEFRVLDSDNSEVPKGVLAAWREDYKFPDSAAINIAKLVAAAAGENLESLSDSRIAELLGSGELVGKKLYALATPKPTKSGGTFTKVSFFSAE